MGITPKVDPASNMKLLLVFAAILAPSLGARLPYIVGGQDVKDAGKWPWQASIQMWGSHICGAAIISETWVVTAAHCVESAASQLSVVVGMHDRTTQRQGDPQRHQIRKIIQHPGWGPNSNGFPNDIALMQLKTSADLSGQYAQAVHLADSGTDFMGNSDCWITGWGKLSFMQGPPNILQEASVDVYSKSTCTASYGDAIQDFHICVGKKQERRLLRRQWWSSSVQGGRQLHSGGCHVIRAGHMQYFLPVCVLSHFLLPGLDRRELRCLKNYWAIYGSLCLINISSEKKKKKKRTTILQSPYSCL